MPAELLPVFERNSAQICTGLRKSAHARRNFLAWCCCANLRLCTKCHRPMISDTEIRRQVRQLKSDNELLKKRRPRPTQPCFCPQPLRAVQRPHPSGPDPCRVPTGSAVANDLCCQRAYVRAALKQGALQNSEKFYRDFPRS